MIVWRQGDETGGRFYRLLVCPKPDGTVFTFDEDGRAKKETYSNGLIRDFVYTSNQTVISGSNGINITYNLNGFGEVAEYKLQNGENNKDYSYTYDSDGNITTISLNGSLQQTFTYNSSNELVRVDDAAINKTVTYDYDYVGNITSVKTYIYTTGTLGTPLTTQNYTYNSQNQRTDLGYDANGNMTSLNGFDFTWDGRKLSSAICTDTNISYTYNHNGIRTSKTVNGTTIIYTVDVNNNVIEQTDGTNTIKFVYDSSSSPIYMEYNGVIYYYEENLQGDIVAILDANGNTVVEYSYDIWGKLLGITGELADTLGVSNPLRYRGYYYDTEIGLYYLQSRYYSPDLMRFISQDDPALSNDQGQPLGSNLYVYCLNNPVMNIDPTGESLTVILVCAAIGAIVGGLAGYGLSRILKVPKGKRWKYVLGGAVIGAVIGGCIGYAVGAAGSSGIVLWSGGGVKGAGGHAAKFAAENGLKTLEMTRKGKLLTKMNSAAVKILGKNNGYKFMKPFWNAASKQFVKSAAGKQVYVNVFISVSQFSDASVFAKIEYEIVRSLGMKIIWHFVK